MTLALFDQTLDMGADGNTLIVDAAQPHGFKFAPGGGGAMTRIAQVICAGSQAVVTFSSIPQTYTNLQVMLSGRDTKATVNDAEVRLRVNNDTTGGNYTVAQYLTGAASAATANTNAPTNAGAWIASIPGTSLIANAVGWANVWIPNYTNTVFEKIIASQSGDNYTTAANLANYLFQFVWKSTAAINRLDFSAGGTAFVDGSTFTLYGLQ